MSIAYMYLATILGTGNFIKENGHILVQEKLTPATECNKDTGGRKTLQSWSRGIFFVVSAGGHIKYWQPLYRLLNCKSSCRIDDTSSSSSRSSSSSFWPYLIVCMKRTVVGN